MFAREEGKLLAIRQLVGKVTSTSAIIFMQSQRCAGSLAMLRRYSRRRYILDGQVGS
jgi:hypothetical protein